MVVWPFPDENIDAQTVEGKPGDHDYDYVDGVRELFLADGDSDRTSEWGLVRFLVAFGPPTRLSEIEKRGCACSRTGGRCGCGNKALLERFDALEIN